MTPDKVLIIEDDPDIVKVVQAYLTREGYQVLVETRGPEGLERAEREAPDLIVLDWMLPGFDGSEVLRRLRQRKKTPVIMLTARGEEVDRILGLELGADDYVVKPFSPRELVARVRAVLRRQAQPVERDEAPLARGPLRLDPRKRTVTFAGRGLELTSLEFDLLYTLAEEPGRVFTRNQLLARVWGEDFGGVDRVVDVHMSNLRQKLEDDPHDPQYLLTVRGVGYKFREPGAS